MLSHRTLTRWAAAVAIAALCATALSARPAAHSTEEWRRPASVVVVANRGAGSITTISLPDLAVDTFPMPPGARTAEPMYVVSGGPLRVLVGDRANQALWRGRPGIRQRLFA
jgi:hypothetical protein